MLTSDRVTASAARRNEKTPTRFHVEDAPLQTAQVDPLLDGYVSDSLELKVAFAAIRLVVLLEGPLDVDRVCNVALGAWADGDMTADLDVASAELAGYQLERFASVGISDHEEIGRQLFAEASMYLADRGSYRGGGAPNHERVR